jgi:hypothetical protein
VIVPSKLTPLAPQEAAVALAAAYRQMMGVPPTEPVLALLIAQSALETRNWQRIHNYNFANLKAGASYPLTVQFRCSEVVNGVTKIFEPPASECNFRAYESAAAGALDYLRVLHARPHWWQGLQTEDPSAFVDALATPPKFFTLNPALYKSALTSLLMQYRPLALGVLGRPTYRPAPQAPAAGSHSPSGSGSSLSPSWLVPQEDLVDDSGVRTSAARLAYAALRQEKSGVPIALARPRNSFSRLLKFIARSFARVFGRSSP